MRLWLRACHSITDFEEVSPLTQRSLISPSVACDLIINHFANRKSAQSFLLTYVGSGAIYLCAQKTFGPGKKEAPNKRIAADTIRRQNCRMDESFWQAATWKSGKTEYVGIQFDKDQVMQAAAANATAFSQSPSRKSPNPGGRPSGKHGEPIAALTLQYLNKPLANLNRITAASLEDDLRKEYLKRGYGGPARENREAMCAGLLRAIRAHREEIEKQQKT